MDVVFARIAATYRTAAGGKSLTPCVPQAHFARHQRQHLMERRRGQQAV